MQQSKSHVLSRTSAAPRQGHRTVFRVTNYTSQKAQPHGSDEPSERIYHPRRPHRKSRSGCSNCKQRRVKCDEAKPHCLRCQKHGIECRYAAPTRPRQTKHVVTQFIEHSPELISVDSLAFSMSLLLVAERLDELLRPCPAAQGQQPTTTLSDTPVITRNLKALQHFHEVTVTSVSSKKGMGVMMNKMMQLAFETPFLMHTIIALATTHLCHVVPDNSAYRLAEAYHWQQAVTQYSKEVALDVNENNMDKLYSACLLLTVHSFMLEEYNPRTSFVFSDDPTALNWLFLQGGLRHLLERTGQWLPRSMWWATFMESSHDPNTNYNDERPGRIDLDPDLADVCGIDDTTTIDTNPYLWPLRMLMNLLPLPRASASFQKYCNWMGRLLPPYLERLLQKDPPALLLLAWWLALMCSVDVWWVDARVHSECTAICMWLEDSVDPRVLRLLEFPAQACGYLLRHVQEREAIEHCHDLAWSA